MAPKVTGEAAAAVSQPAWKNLKGVKRVQAEFKHLSKDIAAGKFTFIKELSLAGDDLLTWQLKLWHFDEDCEGGKNLNKDLEQLNRRFGQDHILMEISFPKDYPHQPFFIRVISPRCVMYTGHVTAGGSICLESLTLSGTPGSWQPDFSVESLLNVILINMIDCPVTIVQTATGPGGVSGPLRIDFNHRPTSGYSSAEAKAAFARTLENHKRMGWGGEGEAAAGGTGTARSGLGAGSSKRSSRMTAAAGMFDMRKSSFGGLSGQRVSTPVMNNSAGRAVAAGADDDTDAAGQRKRRSNAAAAAAAAGAQSSAAGAGTSSKPPGIGSGVPDRDLQQQRRANVAAAAAGSPPSSTAAAGAGAGSKPPGAGSRLLDRHQQRWRPVPKRTWPAAAAAAAAAVDTGSDVVMLVSDSDDEEQQLRAAITESLKVHTGAASSGAAAAAAGGGTGSRRNQTGQTASSSAAAAAAGYWAGRAGRAARGLQSAAALDVDDDVAIVNPRTARDRQQQQQQQGPAAAGGNGNARPGVQTVRQQWLQSAAAAYISDSDSDDDEVISLTAPTPKRRAQETGAAAAAAALPAGSTHKRRAQDQGAAAAAAAAARGAARRNAAQQQDDVVVGSQDGNNDDVQVVGGKHAPAAAVGAVVKRARRVIQDLRPKQQQAGQKQQQHHQQWSSSAPAHPAPPVQPPQQPAGLQSVHLHQQIARVQQQLHAPDGFVGARVHLQLEYPSYWDYSQPINTSTVRLVPLPINGNAQTSVQHPTDPLEAAAAAAQLSDEDIDQLEMQGLSRADALAALLLAGGDAEEAQVRAITCLEVGGCAAVWRSMNVPQQAPRNRDAQQQQQQQEEAAARRVAEEVESILAMFDSTGNGQVDRSKIVSIERIQHSKLWRRYCLKRQEIIESRGEEGLNERLLFHGTAPGVADIITKEGFDFRLVSHASSFGNGTYFADHSHTAFGYCAKPDMSATANGYFGPGFGFGGPPPLAPPAGPSASFLPGLSGLSNLGAALPWTLPYHTGPSRLHTRAVPKPASLQQQSTAGCYKMLVARVALGRQTTGQSGMRKPPEGHDSVNSGSAAVPGLAGGSRFAGGRGGKSSGRKGAAWGAQQGQQYFCHVVFDNDQCYPEYLITFRPR